MAGRLLARRRCMRSATSVSRSATGTWRSRKRRSRPRGASHSGRSCREGMDHFRRIHDLADNRNQCRCLLPDDGVFMLTDERRAHQCRRDGCDSEARWQMFVRFDTFTYGGTFVPLTGKSTIKVCDKHREDAVNGFLSELNLNAIEQSFKRQNLKMPAPWGYKFEFADLREHGGH